MPFYFYFYSFVVFIEETIINTENIFKSLMSDFTNLWLQVYIVYMGDLPKAGDISISSFHTNMLLEVVGR